MHLLNQLSSGKIDGYYNTLTPLVFRFNRQRKYIEFEFYWKSISLRTYYKLYKLYGY